MKKEGYIYHIINTVNNKFYIGSSTTKNRKKTHFYQLRRNQHHCIHLQRAFNKHGEAAFKFVIIEQSQDCRAREQEILDTLDFSKVYNVSTSASGGDLIENHPDRVRLKKQAAENLRKAPKPQPRFKEANPNWRGGKTFCECGNRIAGHNKTCASCRVRSGDSNPFYGKKHTEETKEKVRQKRLGTYNGNQERKVLINSVEYRSVSKAAKELNVSAGTICHRIKSKNDKFKDYKYMECL
jgi:group I intron endonuclease